MGISQVRDIRRSGNGRAKLKKTPAPVAWEMVMVWPQLESKKKSGDWPPCLARGLSRRMHLGPVLPQLGALITGAGPSHKAAQGREEPAAQG